MKSTWKLTSLSMRQKGRVRVRWKLRVACFVNQKNGERSPVDVCRMNLVESRCHRCIVEVGRERVNCHQVHESPLKLSEFIMRIIHPCKINCEARLYPNRHSGTHTDTNWPRHESFSSPFSCILCIRSHRIVFVVSTTQHFRYTPIVADRLNRLNQQTQNETTTIACGV